MKWPIRPNPCENGHRGTFSDLGCFESRIYCNACGERVTVEEMRAAFRDTKEKIERVLRAK